MIYTLGLKRKFLPGFKKYKVTSHDVGGTEGAYRLLLACTDGSHIYAFTPSFKLFPDYHEQATAEEQKRQALEQARTAGAQEGAQQAAQAFQQQLAAAQQAQRQIPQPMQHAPVAQIRTGQ